MRPTGLALDKKRAYTGTAARCGKESKMLRAYQAYRMVLTDVSPIWATAEAVALYPLIETHSVEDALVTAKRKFKTAPWQIVVGPA